MSSGKSRFLALAFAVTTAFAADSKPVFPYGAVYFRKTNPPEQDWARDHKTAAQVGMNTFRHWFMWGAIEVAPGKYDWRDYDRMMDLAAQNGIKVIVAELLNYAPEWAFHKYPHARYMASDGSVLNSGVIAGSEVGGAPGLCPDNPEIRAAADRFLRALVEHYRNHPALLGYDLWNENTYNGGSPQKMYCYCDATKRKLREWLRTRYGTLDQVGRTWHRYSYASWADIDPPINFQGYSDSLDWLEFRVDNAFEQFHAHAEMFRKLDPNHMIAAHGVAGTLESLPSSAHNEWRSAAEVDTWGFTWVASRKGDEPWKQFHAVDLVRAGSRGKPFWHAEAQGGPLWMQPQVIGRAREDGRITDENDIRLWNMISCAGGASGILYPRWRPLLDGPLFGAFGPFAMDGSITPRAQMAGRFAKWANSHPEIWKSHPVQGDIGIVFVPESELFNYVQQGDTNYYAQSARGAYQAFFDSNIQADFVSVEDIGKYKTVYLPYPVMLKNQTVARLRKYVADGGRLISEGLPAYFGDHGHVGTTQPNFGLDELFGARESYVEFTPDLSEKMTLEVNGLKIDGRYFTQEYEVRDGKPAGHYGNGHIAAVSKGRTLLIGTFPGAGYYLHHSPESKAFFAGLAEPQVRISNTKLQARMHTGAGGNYLWVVNPTHAGASVTVSLSASLPAFHTAEDVWGGQSIAIAGRDVTVRVPARDAAVIALR